MTSNSRQQAWAELRAAVEAQVRAAYAIGPGAVVSVVLALLEQYEQVMAAELAAIEARVAALEAARRKDSHNSSQPPSQDATRTGRTPKSLRGKPGQSGQRSGGQPGHPGTTLALRAEPDAVVVHAPVTCAACGHGFAAEDPPAVLVPGERRQVFELPPLRLVATEHQVHERRCPTCAAVSRGTFPPAVRTTVQYGPRVLALGVALTAEHLVPVQRAADIVASLTGQRVSPATLLAAEQRVAETVTPVVAHIHAGLQRSAVVGFDETGFFVARVRQWLHVACTRTLAYYTAHPKRGTGAHDAIGLLPTYAGTALHDGYASYFTYRGCRHALCGVHLLRDLTWLAEEGAAATRRWAAAFKRGLKAMKRGADRARAAGAAALAPRPAGAITGAITGAMTNSSPSARRPSRRPRRRGRTAAAAAARRARSSCIACAATGRRCCASWRTPRCRSTTRRRSATCA